jgi:hypothetical protein
MALPKYVNEYYEPFTNQQKKDFYDAMTPKWSNAMAKQYNIEADEEEYYKGFKGMDINKLVDTNLKTAAAQGKPKLSDVPPVALFALGAAMSDGASKYGRYNWRETGTTASVFYDAMHRHLADWYNGEDFAHDSKVNHLAHIMASCAILLDSELHSSMNDDRDKSKSESIARNETWKTL